MTVLGLSTHERADGLHSIERAGAAGYFTKGDDSHRLMDALLRLHEAKRPTHGQAAAGGA